MKELSLATGPSMSSGRLAPAAQYLKRALPHAGLALALGVYGFVLARSAWVSDDAYITFRTVDNFVSGYGLTWNVAERVQTYTHPLWMFLIAGLYAVTREAYFTSLALSAALSAAALLVVALGIARSRLAGVFAILILSLSRAFVDYSTSGLENPLTHLLIALFLFILLRRELTLRTFFWLSLTAGLLAVNRLDAVVMAAPALAYGLYRLRSVRAVMAAAAGFAPLLAWELFSLLYYGFPFPNTAYAKLNTGIPPWPLFQGGLRYFAGSLAIDPLTASLIALGLALAVALRGWKNLTAALGVGLYCLYIAKVGGDFMAGRFLSAPLLAAISLAAGSRLAETKPGLPWLAALAAALGLSLAAPYPTLLTDASFPAVDHRLEWTRQYNVWDERATYFSCAGLLNVLGNPEVRRCPGAIHGMKAREDNLRYMVATAVGELGYYAGPVVFILDAFGLGDPLLARLPTANTETWVTGHFIRRVPAGYPATIRRGHNAILDPSLARYYDDIALATRGDLLDPRRLEALWRLNTGQDDRLILDSATLRDIARQTRLVGWGPEALAPGQTNTVSLEWQMTARPPYEIHSYAYLFDASGARVSFTQSRVFDVPDGGGLVRSQHAIETPGAAPAVYRMEVGLSSPVAPGNEWPRIAERRVKVPPPTVSLPPDLHAAQATLGGEIALLGYTATRDGQTIDLGESPTGPITVTLYWRALKRPQGDYHVFVHASSQGALVAQTDDAPYHGDYPTGVWDPGEVVATVMSLDIPPQGEGLSFLTGMYLLESGERLPAVQDGQPTPDGRIALAGRR